MAKERHQPYYYTNNNHQNRVYGDDGDCPKRQRGNGGGGGGSKMNRLLSDAGTSASPPPERHNSHHHHLTLANHNNKRNAARRGQKMEESSSSRKNALTSSNSSHNTHTTTINKHKNKQRQSPVSSSLLQQRTVKHPGGAGEEQSSDVDSGTMSVPTATGPLLLSNKRGSNSSNPRRRSFQLRSSTLRRILSSTFKDLSLGYYISIVMVISFKIFIFANTLNTVMGAKTFYMHWNTSNSIFRIDNTDHIIDVNKGNLAFEYDQVHIICPVYEPGTFDNETEKLIIYNVSKAEYETCRITNANPRIIAVCDKPQKLMYFTITFRPFTPSPGGLEFLPGHDYYFISTSSKDDLHRRIGGRCSTNNMKVVFKVCCGGGGGNSDSGGSTIIGGADSNRTSSSSSGRGGSKNKALAVTTQQPPYGKIFSVPSSPAVVSHRPTLNQPVVLQNDFGVATPVQNHSYNGNNNGGVGGSNWQSSTVPATKKPSKPSDKWANDVVKYDQELNVNEKSTSNEMVAGDAVSWHRRQQLGGLLMVMISGMVAVAGLQRQQQRWLY